MLKISHKKMGKSKLKLEKEAGRWYVAKSKNEKVAKGGAFMDQTYKVVTLTAIPVTKIHFGIMIDVEKKLIVVPERIIEILNQQVRGGVVIRDARELIETMEDLSTGLFIQLNYQNRETMSRDLAELRKMLHVHDQSVEEEKPERVQRSFGVLLGKIPNT